MEYAEVFFLSLVSIVCFVLLSKLYYRNQYIYWKEQNIPHMKTYIFVGSFKLKDKPLHEAELELYNKYGRIYGRYDGQTPALSVAEPNLLKYVFLQNFDQFMNRRDMRFNDPVMDNTLFALEGKEWKRVRSIVSPTLTQANVNQMLPLMNDCADVLVDNIKKTVKEKKNVECQRLFGSYVIDTIARCALGMKITSSLNEDDIFLKKAKSLLDCCFGWRTIITMICPQLMKVFRIQLFNPETTTFYRNIILQLIDKRKNIKVGRNDVFQLLLDSQKNSQEQNNKSKCATSTNTDQVSQSLNSNNTLKSLSQDELIAQCVSFFSAGYDSTTSLLSYAIYNLAVNETYQKRALDELEAVMEKHNGVLNYESLKELTFMQAVIDECLRLCPSIVRNERRVMEDCKLGDTNIRLKQGMIISIPVYAIHRDPEWYPEPDSFKPERFYEPDPSRPDFAHLPFGAGRRLCIGQKFVLMAVKLCIAKVLLNFHAKPANSTPENLQLIEKRNVLKVEDVEICFEERS